jgi:kinetochore protein Spc7/SPC105
VLDTFILGAGSRHDPLSMSVADPQAANKMREDIKAGHEELSATERLSSTHNPPVIKDYLSAPDEEKQLFEMTFKQFKTNTLLKARERWYDWKMSLIGKIRPDVEELLRGMQAVSGLSGGDVRC